MCGIVGLFLKDPKLEPKLGDMLTDMLITMTDRGPDSAGIAIYGEENSKKSKLTVQSDSPAEAFGSLEKSLGKVLKGGVSLSQKDTHAVLEMATDQVSECRRILMWQSALIFEK